MSIKELNVEITHERNSMNKETKQPEHDPKSLAEAHLKTACVVHDLDPVEMAKRESVQAALQEITKSLESLIFQLKRKRVILTEKDADVHLPMCEKDFYRWLARNVKRRKNLSLKFSRSIVAYLRFDKKTMYIDDGDLKTMSYTHDQFWHDEYHRKNNERRKKEGLEPEWPNKK